MCRADEAKLTACRKLRVCIGANPPSQGEKAGKPGFSGSGSFRQSAQEPDLVKGDPDPTLGPPYDVTRPHGMIVRE